MRIVVFGPQLRVGAWEGERVVDLNAADPSLPAGLQAFIEAGPAALERARAALASGGGEPASAAKLHAPAVYRPRIACAAGNFAIHTLGSSSGRASAAEAPESKALAGLAEPGQTLSAEDVVAKTRERGRPRGFWKDFALATGPEDEVPIPDRAALFDYEGELAVVIGKRAKDVKAEDAAEYIWGLTLLNDWSIRGADKSRESLSLNLSKNF